MDLNNMINELMNNSNCGCNNNCGTNDCGMNNCNNMPNFIPNILQNSCGNCGCGNNCGNGCSGNNSWIWWILLLLCGCGGNNCGWNGGGNYQMNNSPQCYQPLMKKECMGMPKKCCCCKDKKKKKSKDKTKAVYAMAPQPVMNCGYGNNCGNNWILWLLIILACCGNNFGNNCGNNNGFKNIAIPVPNNNNNNCESNDVNLNNCDECER